MDEKNALVALTALAQPTRLKVFRRLLAAHPAGLAAGEIARQAKVPHNTMSTHLGLLTRARLVAVRRDGRSMNYRANLDGFRALVSFLTRDCCSGRPEICAPLLAELSDLTDECCAPARLPEAADA
jgi:DNA-binding transcriptional ArsR family regulator